MTTTSAPMTRTVDALPATPIEDAKTRNWWPSRCEFCGLNESFPTKVERLRFELLHSHGGAD